VWSNVLKRSYMAAISDYILYQTVNGQPVQVGEKVVTPQSQVLALNFMGGPAGAALVWNRPLAVLVEQNGETKRYPIVDVTRLAQVALFTAVLMTVMIAGLLKRERR
jgi:hypothetical protein